MASRASLARQQFTFVFDLFPQIGTFVSWVDLDRLAQAQFIREAIECSSLQSAPLPLAGEDQPTSGGVSRHRLRGWHLLRRERACRCGHRSYPTGGASQETAILLKAGYLNTVDYGFKDGQRWVLQLRYTATAGGQLRG